MRNEFNVKIKEKKKVATALERKDQENMDKPNPYNKEKIRSKEI